ncbi:helix-turn-helix domain-containing protein [Gordonia sp. (in: high G+C Gram-positive bacteria)]|uniref:helix-turn-helix domain-containing protein n=1 Tax=Gordonia sp. (in: high G+C Gram-positive bacteria) TaxID=84139 RepID=UPI0016A7EFD4|nr:helix-turn-helix domain-containing protein [Gordonia sp. (in: high G+C Gram-positive bacteria)]NLG47454.1 helix-turn-helix domain-containing protein [Gordonia sp. (in: high G+C Gram-positive bacteria)]
MTTEGLPAGRRARAHHRTVDRVAAIMETAARSGSDGVTLTDLAAQVGAPVSSMQGLVNGLVAVGYLDERARRYVLGGAPYLLNRLAGRAAVASVRHDDLEWIHQRTGLTTVLSIAVGSGLFYVDYCSSDPRFAYLAENHVRRSLTRTSSGWVLLADMDKRDLWPHLRELGDDDPALVDRFLAALPGIAETGICAAPHASLDGDGAAIAVTEDGRTVAAVSVIGSHEEVSARAEELVDILREAADRWRD